MEIVKQIQHCSSTLTSVHVSHVCKQPCCGGVKKWLKSEWLDEKHKGEIPVLFCSVYRKLLGIKWYQQTPKYKNSWTLHPKTKNGPQPKPSMSPLSLTQEEKKNGFSFWPQSQLSLFAVLKHGTQRQELWPAEPWPVAGGSWTPVGGWATRGWLGLGLTAQHCLPETCMSRHAAGRQASKTPLEALFCHWDHFPSRSLHSLSQKAPKPLTLTKSRSFLPPFTSVFPLSWRWESFLRCWRESGRDDGFNRDSEFVIVHLTG